MRDTPETEKQIRTLATRLGQLEQNLPVLLSCLQEAGTQAIPVHVRDLTREIADAARQALVQLQAPYAIQLKKYGNLMEEARPVATILELAQGLNVWLPGLAEGGQQARELVAPELIRVGEDQASTRLHVASDAVRMYASEADEARQRIVNESQSPRQIRDWILRDVNAFNMSPGNIHRMRGVAEIARALRLSQDTVGVESVYLVEVGDLQGQDPPSGAIYPRVRISPQGRDTLDRVHESEVVAMRRESPMAANSTPSADARETNNIFIVHGHDEAVLHKVTRYVENDLGLKAIILHEQPGLGRTLIEKFEDHAAEAHAAIVLLTGDDLGGVKPTGAAGESPDLKPRARQNVVFELGFFIGKLGRHSVFPLKQADVEIPGDYLGVNYIPLGGQWKDDLRRELKVKFDIK